MTPRLLEIVERRLIAYRRPGHLDPEVADAVAMPYDRHVSHAGQVQRLGVRPEITATLVVRRYSCSFFGPPIHSFSKLNDAERL